MSGGFASAFDYTKLLQISVLFHWLASDKCCSHHLNCISEINKPSVAGSSSLCLSFRICVVASSLLGHKGMWSWQAPESANDQEPFFLATYGRQVFARL